MDKKLKREITYNTVPKLRDGILEIEFDGSKYVISPWLKRRIIIKNIVVFLQTVVLVFAYNYVMGNNFDINVSIARWDHWKLALIYTGLFIGFIGCSFILITNLLMPRDFSDQVKTIEEYLEDMK